MEHMPIHRKNVSDSENQEAGQQILLVARELSALKESFSFNCQKGFMPHLDNISKCLDGFMPHLNNISKCLDGVLSFLNRQVVTLNAELSRTAILNAELSRNNELLHRQVRAALLALLIIATSTATIAISAVVLLIVWILK